MTQPQDYFGPRVEIAQEAFRPSGVFYRIASELVTDPFRGLSETAVGDILLPNKDPATPRWQLIEGASAKQRELYKLYGEEILDLAYRVGIRQEESISAAELLRLKKPNVVVTISGANRTFVVRPALAERVMEEAALDQPMYIVTSERPIAKTRNDGSENPEHAVVASLAPDFLDATTDTNEHNVTIGVTKQLGYEIDTVQELPNNGRITEFLGSNGKKRIVVFPGKTSTVMEDGLSIIHEQEDLSGKQIILATNGQYRMTVGLGAEIWRRKQGLTTPDQPLVLGDEAGFTVEHLDKPLITAQRASDAYPNEFVVIQRMAQKLRDESL